MSEKWIILVNDKAAEPRYASDKYFRDERGRPLVKDREKALELTTDECHDTRGYISLYSVLWQLRSFGVPLKDVSVNSADPRFELLGLGGWWNLLE